MPLTLPAAPTPPTLANPATFEANASASLAWMTALATAMSGNVLLASDIQRGSNSNGEYVRFPDGTQICWMETPGETANTANGSIFVGTVETTYTFPAAFIGDAFDVACSFISRNSLRWGNARALSGTTYNVRQWAALASSTFNAASVIAIGRWF